MGLERAIHQVPVADRSRFDRRGQALVGNSCRACSAVAWPPRAVCHRCGSPDVDIRQLARRGDLLSFTQVHVARPGHDSPYTLGQVHLDGPGPIVFGNVVGLPADARLPAPVVVRVAPGEGSNPAYWFEALDRD
jgi:uncharacterized OB-fold protein